MARLAEWIAIGKTVARVTHESDIRYVTTALAYYAFISFVPLLVLVVASVGWQFAGRVSASPAQFQTPETQDVIYESLPTASGRTLAVAILAILLQSLVLAFLAPGVVGTIAGFALLLPALTVTFLPLYYAPSRVVDSVRGAFPGAVATACSWTVLHAVIQFYAVDAAQYAVYGVLSGVIIVLTNTYIAAVFLMMGIVVNAALAIDPDELRDRVRE
jgi:membrane protein